MITKTMLSILAGALALGSMGSAADAKQLTAKERQRLEANRRAQESIARDWNSAAQDYDRAYRAAKAADATFKFAIRRVPGGRIVYGASKSATRAAIRAAKRKGN